jgi:hypothetical protein
MFIELFRGEKDIWGWEKFPSKSIPISAIFEELKHASTKNRTTFKVSSL